MAVKVGESEKPSLGKMKAIYYSACGSYCGACTIMIASEKADNPEKVKCLGCLSEKLNPDEMNCELMKCAKMRKVKVCVLCKDYPCGKTNKFYSQKNVWTAEMVKNLAVIKEKGLDKWLEEQKARWSCPKCGVRVSYCDKKCPKCGTGLKNIG
jgi:hypothetical protein